MPCPKNIHVIFYAPTFNVIVIPNGTSSLADTTATRAAIAQHTHTHWIFSSFQWYSQSMRFLFHVQGQAGGIALVLIRGETPVAVKRERGGDRNAGDAHVGSTSSRRPPEAIGNDGEDWDTSRSSSGLRLGCDGESVVSIPSFSSSFDEGVLGS